MADRSREIRSRPARLVAYLSHNGERMLVDLLVLGAWLLATTTLFGALGFPSWLFYLILLIGVIVYSRITPPWTRPYRSPDLEAP